MSTHAVPYGMVETVARIACQVLAGRASAVAGPLPDLVQTAGLSLAAADGNGANAFVFTPDLTGPEAALFDAVVLFAHSQRGPDLTRFQSVSAEYAGLKAYMGVATPTLVQTAAALKALITVLRAVLDD